MGSPGAGIPPPAGMLLGSTPNGAILWLKNDPDLSREDSGSAGGVGLGSGLLGGVGTSSSG